LIAYIWALSGNRKLALEHAKIALKIAPGTPLAQAVYLLLLSEQNPSLAERKWLRLPGRIKQTPSVVLAKAYFLKKLGRPTGQALKKLSTITGRKLQLIKVPSLISCLFYAFRFDRPLLISPRESAQEQNPS